MGLYELQPHRELESPVLVLGMEGWIDAGLGAGAAIAHVLEAVPTEQLATFDGDQLIDYRARRPTVRIADGVNTGLSWPTIQVRLGQDRAGKDVLALVGPEPDMRWHAFVDAVVELGRQLGVSLVVALGAFPAPVPHTRPVRLAATSSSRELAERVGVVPGTIEVPAGIHAALDAGFTAADIPAMGLWARVPHYAAAMPYPAASAALVEGLASVAGLDLDPQELRAAADMTSARIDQIIASSEEHGEMVRQLEASADAEETAPPLDLTRLPSGDEIAAELERFLRGEG
jgi:hypothetical protein